MTEQLIKREIIDHVAVVTMDAPPVNAQTKEFMEQLIACFDELNDIAEARVIVLTGAGKAFSAGADIKSRQMPRGPGENFAHMRRAREVGFCIMESYKPVIAAINGPALGAGLGLAVCADILIAAEKAVVGLPEIDVGLMGGARHVMRLFPHSIARQMVLTGYRPTGAELYRLGVVSACTTAENLMPTTMAMARNMAEKSPAALRLAKRALNTVEHMPLKDGYRFEQNLTVEMTKHEDSKEAMRAFMEKRKPIFKDI